MNTEQKIRTMLYYFSLFIFFGGLPFIVSFALGYKFNPHTLKFTRTGLLVIKTQPLGAAVYLNSIMLKERTPAVINEILPGKYVLELRYPGHASYNEEIEIDAGKVLRREKIILFPERPFITKLNQGMIHTLWMDEAKGTIYYVNEEDNSLYKSDYDGMHFKKIANFSPIQPRPRKWKLSPDREKVLYFNAHKIGIIYLKADDSLSFPETVFILEYPSENIHEVFWHSDNYHLIVVTDKKICTLEANPHFRTLTLVTLNRPSPYCYYDVRTDTIYFMDSQKADNGKIYDNFYKLELNAKFYPIQEFMRLRPSFERMEYNNARE